MTTIFYRLTTDNSQIPVALENTFAGPTMTACWLIGGGPSLTKLPVAAIGESPLPKMCINLSGSQLLRPTFWTSYDPSVRFHRSVYLDPGVMKFVHRRRSTDLIPETTFKVCDCPNLYFFDREGDRGFDDFLPLQSKGIVDWADSMVQAIEILYRLGFRIIYLAGCEMRVRPSQEQIERAAQVGVRYKPNALLQDFVRECTEAGLSAEDLDALPPGPHYHFDEQKPIRAAAGTDTHYFRISQYLRLSRRSMSLAGLSLISVTPHSRLNDYFPYQPARKVLRCIDREIGNPKTEKINGLYRQTEPRQSRPWGPMRDFRPHNWSRHGRPQNVQQQQNGNGHQQKVDGEILPEAEGFQKLIPAVNGNEDRQDLNNRLKRLAAIDFNPREEG